MSIDSARKAVEKFQKMIPLFQSFAESCVGRRIPIVIPGNSSPKGGGLSAFNDGKTIYILPPATLAEDLEHDREWCGNNRTNGISYCPACAQFEYVFSSVCHEIAHLVGNSITEGSTIPAIARKESPRWGATLLNLLEDVRIEEIMFKSQVGTRIMRFATMTSVLGLINKDALSLDNWGSIAILTRATEYEQFTDWPESVRALLDDPDLAKVIQAAKTAESAENIPALIRPLLCVTQRYGIFQEEKEPEEKKPEDEEPEDDNESEPSDEAESNSEEDSRDESKDESDSSDGGDSSEGSEPSEDEDSNDAGESDGSEDSNDSDGDSHPSEGSEENPNDSDNPDGVSEDESDGTERDDSTRSEASDEETDEVSRNESEDSAGEPDDSQASTSESDGNNGVGNTSGEPDSEESDGEEESSTESIPGDDGTLSKESECENSGLDSDEDESEAGNESETSNHDGGTGVQGSGQESASSNPEANGEHSEPTPPEPESLDPNSPEDVAEMIRTLMGHDEIDFSDENLDRAPIGKAAEFTEDDVRQAATVAEVFAEKAGDVIDLTEYKYDDRKLKWEPFLNSNQVPFTDTRYARLFDPNDWWDNSGILEGPLSQMRIVFAENDRSKTTGNRRSGKVNTRVLGRRAPIGDDRLFKKRTFPKKRDYAVLIIVDVSGSTGHIGRLTLEMNAVIAQAELLSRLGVKFSIVAHSADYSMSDSQSHRHWGSRYSWSKAVLKHWEEPWTPKLEDRAKRIHPMGANLDGHTMLFARKEILTQRASDRIIMYYSDGSMPAENYDEELALLKSEIKTIRNQGVVLAGVGVMSDAPSGHGLPTVRIQKQSDISKVVEHLQKLMLERG